MQTSMVPERELAWAVRSEARDWTLLMRLNATDCMTLECNIAEVGK